MHAIALAAAFTAGSLAGVLVMALCCAASREPLPPTGSTEGDHAALPDPVIKDHPFINGYPLGSCAVCKCSRYLHARS